MIKDFSGKYLRLEFESIAEMAETVEKNHSCVEIFNKVNHRGDDGWYGQVKSTKELAQLARVGWDKDTETVLKVSEETLRTVEKDFDVQTWQSYYAVAGADVDVARYLSGEPENMIAYTMVDTPRAGRVVTLVANISVSGMTSTQAIESRGKNICALVYALEALGIRTELYTSFGNITRAGTAQSQITVKVKDATDTLDPAMVMFAFAHPAFFRAYMLAAMHEFPEKYHKAFGMYAGGGYGQVVKLVDESVFPEHSIVVDTKMMGEWSPKMAQEFVIENLKDLGLI